MKRPLILSVVAVAAVSVFLLNLWISPDLVLPNLFGTTVILFVSRTSKRLVWILAVLIFCIALMLESWGFHRIPLPDLLLPTIIRLLFIANLITLAIISRFGMHDVHKRDLDADSIKCQRDSLISRNEALEEEIAAAGYEFDLLAGTERLYRGLLEAAPDGMVVVDGDGEIVLLNTRAEKLFGYRRDELVGQSLTNIIPLGFAERLIADGIRSAEEALAQQIGEGRELVGLRKDKSSFSIEIMLSPLKNSDGILITAAIRDITSRKLAENELRLSEECFRLLVNNAAGYSIMMLDPEGGIISWNAGAKQMKGYEASEIIGQNLSCFYLPEAIRAGAPMLELQEAAREGRYEVEGWRVRKDGSRFFANTILTTLRDDHGGVRGFAKTTRDITERRHTELQLMTTLEELRRSNDELLQFANVASHDLQEPLRMVASYTQLLARRYEGRLDADADEFIMYAVDGCSRMQRLIEDLLTYSRVAANAKTLSIVSSEDSLREALANLRVTIEESGALVTNDPLPLLMMDGTQLTSVFQNLVGNALKYRGALSPRVHVSAHRNEVNDWIFSVRDNGLGIDAQYFDRIFILFQRLHGRHAFKGTGIGLAICKKIVERWGGRIWVESELEKGSLFSFSLSESNG